MGSVDLLLSACRQIREEVATMDVDILVGQNVAGLVEKSRPQMEKATKELHLAATMASGKGAILCSVAYCCRVLCSVAWVLHTVAG